MKKALILASVASMIEQFNMGNIKVLQELKYEVHVATNFIDSGTITRERAEELKNKLKDLNVKYYQIDFDRNVLSTKNIQAYKQVKQLIKENKYNIIHIHSPIGGVCGRLAARKERKNGTKVIYTAHGFHFFKGAPAKNWLIYYPVEKWLSKYTDCLITINEEDYNLAKKKFKAKNVEYVPGIGVDENKFNFEMSREERNELRKSLDINEEDFVIIYVAELSKRKNQQMLIKAISLLEPSVLEKVKVLLPGKDSMNGKYQELAKNLNVDKNIQFLGYRTDIPKLMKISDLAVSTSRQEGLPVNLMEAMFCNLPIIATDCRGNRDLVQKESIVGIDSIEELKNKIMQRLANNKKYVYNSIRQYTEKNVLEKVKKIYYNYE